MTAIASINAQVLTDFEGVTSPGPNGGYLFRTPNISGSTSSKIEAAPSPLISQVLNTGIPTGNPNVGINAMFVSWNFTNDYGTPLWVRLTTDSASMPFGRPTLTLGASTALSFDIWSDHSLYVTANIRETETAAAFGANGGATGTIEFLGGNPSAATGNRGLAVAANTWTTLTFEFLNPSVTPVFGFTGNGILDPGVDGRGVLESLGLAFDDIPNNRLSDIGIWMDNFSVVAIPEPSSAAILLGGLLALVAARRRKA